MLVEKLNADLSNEAKRRGALGIISQNMGAIMLDCNGNAVQKDYVLNSDGSLIESNNMVTYDNKTGLLTPNPSEVSMLLADGVTSVDVPKGFFLHPITWRLFPIEGILLSILLLLFC